MTNVSVPRETLQAVVDALMPYRSRITRGYTQVDAALDALRKAIDASKVERKPLAHQQIVTATIDIDVNEAGYFVHIARAIEAAHGIKEQA